MCKFESREDLAAKIGWEGGILEALDYGIKPDDMPEGDEELFDAWDKLYSHWQEVKEAELKVRYMLPEEYEDLL